MLSLGKLAFGAAVAGGLLLGATAAADAQFYRSNFCFWNRMNAACRASYFAGPRRNIWLNRRYGWGWWGRPGGRTGWNGWNGRPGWNSRPTPRSGWNNNNNQGPGWSGFDQRSGSLNNSNNNPRNNNSGPNDNFNDGPQ